jgi:predicted nucleic acid-binding protein
MKRYLIDASSLMILTKKAEVRSIIECLRVSFILDLTFYEVGNAMWKETCLTNFLTKKESESARNMMQMLLARTDRIQSETGNFQKILDISEDERITFYDASYLFFAKEKGLVLVTEDRKLKAKAGKHVNVQMASAFL